MRQNIQTLTVFLCLICFLFARCTKTDNPQPATPSSDKLITSFVLAKADNPSLSSDVTATITADSVKLVLPTGGVPGNFIPTIVTNGKSVSPGSKVVQNFSGPLVYTVTAQDGTTKAYSFTARVQSSSDKDITTFQFKVNNNTGILTTDVTGRITSDSVYLTLPFGTALTNLTPAIVITGKSVSPSSLATQNFTNPVTYLVTAEDGSTKKYVAKVTVDPPAAILYMTSKYFYGSPPVTGKLYAIDANTGLQKWRYETLNSPPVYSSGAYVSNTVYAIMGYDVVAIDAMTGTKKWSYTPSGAPLTAPCYAGGKIYVNCDDQKLYAIDAASGAFLWVFTLGASVSNTHNRSTPTVINGVVFFGGNDQYVYAVNATNGALVWKTYNTDPYGAKEFQSSPCVVNGMVYIGDILRNVIAYNAASGTEVWRYRILNGSVGFVVSSPTVDNGTLYVGSYSKYLYALDASNGSLKWNYYTGTAISSSPVVDNGSVFFGTTANSGSAMYAVDASSGTFKWSSPAPYAIEGSPAVFNGTVYFGTIDKIRALNASTGALKWEFTADSDMNTFSYTSPFIVDVNQNVYYSGLSGNHQ